MKTNIELVKWCKSMLGHPYWYGCFGQISDVDLYEKKKRQFPKYYTWKCRNAQIGVKPAQQLGVRVFDCVGLIKGFLWWNGHGFDYKSSQDLSANGMYEACTIKGKISSMPDIKGILVFMNGHVGVYIGDGYVIEARGHAYGVIKTKLKGRGWKTWGKCPFIEYQVSTNTPKSESKKKTYSGAFPYVTNSRVLKYGSKGENVKKLQNFLNWYCNDNLKIDGIFGRKTQLAVIHFQKKEGLTIDGIFGKKSLAKAKTIKR